VARNRWLLALVQLAPETAMRQGELLRLRWEHIDLNRRTAHLPDTKNGQARKNPHSDAPIRPGDGLAGAFSAVARITRPTAAAHGAAQTGSS